MKPTLKISQDFTLEDIRKIRDYNYEMTKNMTSTERIDYYNQSAEAGFKRIEELKNEKKRKSVANGI